MRDGRGRGGGGVEGVMLCDAAAVSEATFYLQFTLLWHIERRLVFLTIVAHFPIGVEHRRLPVLLKGGG